MRHRGLSHTRFSTTRFDTGFTGGIHSASALSGIQAQRREKSHWYFIKLGEEEQICVTMLMSELNGDGENLCRQSNG